MTEERAGAGVTGRAAHRGPVPARPGRGDVPRSCTAAGPAAWSRPPPALLGLSSTKRAAVLAVVVCALALTVAVPLRNYVAQRQELAAVTEQQRELTAAGRRADPAASAAGRPGRGRRPGPLPAGLRAARRRALRRAAPGRPEGRRPGRRRQRRAVVPGALARGAWRARPQWLGDPARVPTHDDVAAVAGAARPAAAGDAGGGAPLPVRAADGGADRAATAPTAPRSRRCTTSPARGSAPGSAGWRRPGGCAR